MPNQATKTKMLPALPEVSESENQRRIALRAYELWLARSFRKGSPETDWIRAEWEVRGTATVGLRRTPSGLFLVPKRP